MEEREGEENGGRGERDAEKENAGKCWRREEWWKKGEGWGEGEWRRGLRKKIE